MRRSLCWGAARGRRNKERALRRRCLHERHGRKLNRDELLLKRGAANKEAGRVSALVAIRLPDPGQGVAPPTFTVSLRKDKRRTLRRREGSYLLRSKLTGEDPAARWRYSIPLTEIEQAFQERQSDLAIRPLYTRATNPSRPLSSWPSSPIACRSA